MHAGRINPLANRVVVQAASIIEFQTLDVDRFASEEVVAATVVEVQVGVDDEVNAGEVEALLAQWKEVGIQIGHRRVQLRQAGVHQHPRIEMVDNAHIDRQPLATIDDAGRQLLQTAVIIGRSFDLETVREISGPSEDETIIALERLLQQRLIRESPSGNAPAYDFAHDKLGPSFTMRPVWPGGVGCISAWHRP